MSAACTLVQIVDDQFNDKLERSLYFKYWYVTIKIYVDLQGCLPKNHLYACHLYVQPYPGMNKEKRERGNVYEKPTQIVFMKGTSFCGIARNLSRVEPLTS